ncbi:hypothetical protein [Pedosphaera parvula]|uniref:Uncharacterized protein n=1 Tax=Pedosphaera parvula (strain Ellin514) TaxID=320771 RepID=B9XRH5_PEDPL|nr:hypothetical protein [Pedosphaera parvula]EEF57546.1 hypothetical protein Cflav_PD0596 [Pedosphaera parvula Ellin514]
MNQRLLKQVILFGLLYYVVYLCLNGLIILLSHIPPKAFNLDPLILALYNIEVLLAWPRFLLRRLWPAASNPPFFGIILTVVNCLVWGWLLTGFKALWTKVRT